MATQATIGAGRVGLKKLFAVESETVDKEYIYVVGRAEKTTQTTENYKQYAGLGPATQTPEGDDAVFDDLSPLFAQSFKPLLFTKGFRMSKQTEFTDQYAKLKNMTPAIARSFVQRRNLNVADLDNSGFTDTTKGMNSETLYASGHSMGSYFGNNRPLAPGQVASTTATTMDFALSPTTLEYAWADVQNQKSARNLPMFPVGTLDLKVPPALYLPACRALHAIQLAGTNNNDPNELRSKFAEPIQIHYYTSAQAWFIKSTNSAYHGLFHLDQMPYDIEQLPLSRNVMIEWIAYESWCFGWYDWHATYGTAGA